MPELPDVVVYVEALRERILGHTLAHATLRGPFLLRTVQPPIEALYGHRVTDVRRAGKRIAIGFENGLWLAIHLMIAGRLHWNGKRQPVAAFEFDNGALTLTEAGTQHRAQIHVLDAPPETAGLEVLDAPLDAFARALRSGESHAEARANRSAPLQRDRQRVLGRDSASGAAESDRDDAQVVRRRGRAAVCGDARRARAVGGASARAIAAQVPGEGHGVSRGDGGAREVRPSMPALRRKIQRIRYAANETDYCPTCQTNGRLLADRALSRLLREDWPRTPESWRTSSPRGECDPRRTHLLKTKPICD